MNVVFLEEWAEALLSGDYTQGKGFLYNHDNNTHCCLGVACELGVQKGLLTKDEWVFRAVDTDYISSSVLPWSIAELLGMDVVGSLSNYETSLTNLNDGIADAWSTKAVDSATFEDIANLIYQHIHDGDVFLDPQSTEEETD